MAERMLEERHRNAAMLLSTTGAALAGAGVGVLLSRTLQPIALIILGTGLIAHLIGMLSTRRAQRLEGYSRARWEVGAYWVCWMLIGVLLVYAAGRAVTF